MAYPAKRVYLAGPITGLMYQEARNGWRKEFARLVRNDDHIYLFSPMREKSFISNNKMISGTADYASLHHFGTPNGIMTRDHNDVKECDLMIACFLGAKRVSIGTCVEFGWASAYRKPIIMVMEPLQTYPIPYTGDNDKLKGTAVGTETVKNPHDHLFLTHLAGYVVHTLEAAANIARSILTPGL